MDRRYIRTVNCCAWFNKLDRLYFFFHMYIMTVQFFLNNKKHYSF